MLQILAPIIGKALKIDRTNIISSDVFLFVKIDKEMDGNGTKIKQRLSKGIQIESTTQKETSLSPNNPLDS